MNPRIIIRVLILNLLVLSLIACEPEIGNIFERDADSLLRVYLQNGSLETFTVIDGPTVGVSAKESLGTSLGYFQRWSSPEPPFDRSFDISRGERFLARITFRVLRFPAEREIQDATIVITEESPDVFAASTADSEWIAIVAVQNV